MRVALILAGALMLMVEQAFGQDVAALRSGEHSTFSRIVVDAPPPPNWSARHRGRDVVVVLPGLDLTGAEDIFSRMPRTRILSVLRTARGLRLRLGCNCPVQAFALDGRHVVIDVRDPDSMPVVEQPDLVRQPSRQAAEPEPVAADVGDALAETEPAPDLASARQALVRELTRAADQGLLDFIEPPERDTAARPGARPQGSTDESSPSDIETAIDTLRHDDQIRVRTAYDDSPPPAATPPSCGPPNIGLFSRVPLEPDYSEVVDLRAALLGEFDRPDPDVLRDLVERYVAMGFGTEARALLAAYPNVLEETDLYKEMAAIAEGEVATDGPLSTLSRCPGIAGVWGRVAAGRGGAIDEATAALQREALGELPPQPRELIGGALAEVLLDTGQAEAAAGIIALLRRSGQSLSPRAAFVEARIALEMGRVEEGEAALMALTDGPGEVAARATAELVERHLQREEEMPQTLRLDLQAAAFMLRGSSLGERLIGLVAREHAARGDLHIALEAIRRSAEREPDRLDFWREVAAVIVVETEPDTPNFARALTDSGDLIPQDDRGDAARRSGASGLIMLGLPGPALDLLGPTLGRGDEAARILAARALRMSGEPDAALGQLSGLDGVAANLERLDILIRSGAFERARDVLDRIPVTRRPEAARVLLAEREGANDPVAPLEVPDLTAADPRTLQAGRRLLAETAEIREGAGQLLVAE